MKRVWIGLALLVLFLAVPPFAGAQSWQNQARQLIESGAYDSCLYNPNPEFDEMLSERDREWDMAALYDLDRDGVPEVIVQSIYGFEQADVFVSGSGGMKHAGMIGGENFFQFFFYYPDAEGLFTAVGGPMMEIERYTLEGETLQRTEIGETLVDWDAEETIGIRMEVEDAELLQRLYGTLVWDQDSSQGLEWVGIRDLKTQTDWERFFASAR